MSSVTQTIPQFSLGMSEQPDNLKFPGQVTEIVNAIPDITKGLFKRPGSKRVGTTPLANVQSGGSWFHYYRDESEGSYIGQVAADGQVRVWKASGDNAGAEQTVVYGEPQNATFVTSELVSGTGDRKKVTVTLSNHGFSTGDVIAVTSSADSGGDYTGTGFQNQLGATITVTDANTFFYENATDQGAHNGTACIVSATGLQKNVTDYLATNEPENLQFLTINDTTFVNSRDADNSATIVGERGSSTARPDDHFAFLELLRTENGRQYGVDVFRTADVTGVSRATRISITSDTLYEDSGSGQCPGIGTQVFAVTGAASNNYTGTTTISVKDSSDNNLANNARNATINGTSRNIGAPKNLIFRVVALGQQGINPESDNVNAGDDYICSYQREIILLHGGEGWQVGDKVVVELDSAKGGGGANATAAKTTPAQYTVTIEEVEQTEVNATITTNGDGLIRPEPTPFDAQTAVTADTIIGGIIAGLPNGINGKQIGNGIYLSSSSSFTVNIAENDLMRSMQGTVNDVQSLPNQCKHGYIARVANALRSDEDDYYLRFEGQNDKDGSGSWTECAKPGITTTLTNMPLIIQRTALANQGTSSEIATFTVRQYSYGVRDVGDSFTNPMPSFLGKRINKVLFFRNRLAFLSGENVVTSRPGTLGQPNFFIETALTVSVSDPVDISAASMFPSDLYDGLEINAGLLVFSTNQQFLLASDDTVFNPDTAKLRSIAAFNYNEKMPPISLGTTVAYIDNSGKFSRFNEMANSAREGEPNIVEVSKVVPTLLPKDIDLMTNSRENSIVLIGKTGTDEIFGYKYFQAADKRVQAAWFKWKLNNSLLYHFIINDEYFFLDSNNFLQSVKLVQADSDPSIVQDSIDFLLHVDNHTTVSGGSFNATTNLTTFSGVSWLSSVTDANYKLVVIDNNTDSERVGRYAEATVSSTTFTLPGNWDYSIQHEIPHTDINLSNERIAITDHGLSTGDEIKWVQGATAATGLTNGNTYFVIKVDKDKLSLATNLTNANAGTAINITGQGTGTHKIQKPIKDLYIGYLYPYQVKLPTLYPTKMEGQRPSADVNSSLVLHRVKFHFGKVGLYETTLERVGKTDYTEVYESTELDEYDVSDAPYLDEFIKTIPVYEKNTNVEITLKSSHPAPATLRSMSWEGDYSPKYYRRV